MIASTILFKIGMSLFLLLVVMVAFNNLAKAANGGEVPSWYALTGVCSMGLSFAAFFFGALAWLWGI